jgi:hypothetical protein
MALAESGPPNQDMTITLQHWLDLVDQPQGNFVNVPTRLGEGPKDPKGTPKHTPQIVLPQTQEQ